MYHLVNVRLQAEITAMLLNDPQLNQNTSMLISMLSVTDVAQSSQNW